VISVNDYNLDIKRFKNTTMFIKERWVLHSIFICSFSCTGRPKIIAPRRPLPTGSASYHNIWEKLLSDYSQ